MKIPIGNSLLSNNKFIDNSNSKLEINILNNLKFKKINSTKFPAVNLIKLLPNKSSLFETVLVAANDEFVGQFLNKKIRLDQINENIIKLLKKK